MYSDPGYPGPGAYSVGLSEREPPTYSGPLPEQESAWWEDAFSWLVSKIFGGGPEKVADRPTYYGGALQGLILCPGPLTPEQVYGLLAQASTDRVEAARAALVQSDGRWKSEYPPQNLRELAGALVAEAHGGRDCTPGDVPSQRVFSAIRALAPRGGGAGTPGAGPSWPADPGGTYAPPALEAGGRALLVAALLFGAAKATDMI